MLFYSSRHAFQTLSKSPLCSQSKTLQKIQNMTVEASRVYFLYDSNYELFIISQHHNKSILELTSDLHLFEIR